MASPNNIAKLPRIKPGRRGTLAQIIDLQRLLVADAHDPNTTATARAQVARAWDVLEERKRILRMRPKPKDVDTEKLAKERASRRPAEPLFWEPDEPTGQDNQPSEPSPSSNGSALPFNASPLSPLAPPDGGAPGPALPVPKPTAPDRTLKLGHRIAYIVLPEGTRFEGIVTKLPWRPGEIAEMRTDDGQRLPFNPDLVPWEHVMGGPSAA